jgi:hypothetical protein
MLDVAKKMLGGRTRTGLRDDDAAAQLRQQLNHLGARSHVYSDNPDSDADMRAGSVKRRMHAGNDG